MGELKKTKPTNVLGLIKKHTKTPPPAPAPKPIPASSLWSRLRRRNGGS